MLDCIEKWVHFREAGGGKMTDNREGGETDFGGNEEAFEMMGFWKKKKKICREREKDNSF